MSFIDNLASIASNTPLQRLVPNTDVSKHFANYRGAVSDGAYQRELNRQFPNTTVDGFKDEQAKLLNDSAKQGTKDATIERNLRRHSLAGAEATRMHTIQQDSKLVDSQGKINSDGLAHARKGQQEVLDGLSNQRKEASRDLRNDAKDYFFSGDMGTNAMRWGAAASVYGAGAMGTRALTGGSATTNNQGQRDIAGIPFL